MYFSCSFKMSAKLTLTSVQIWFCGRLLFASMIYLVIPTLFKGQYFDQSPVKKTCNLRILRRVGLPIRPKSTFGTIHISRLRFPDILTLWHYRLWSFTTRDTKLETFLHKNQHLKRNYWILRIGLMGSLSSLQKSEVLKLIILIFHA